MALNPEHTLRKAPVTLKSLVTLFLLVIFTGVLTAHLNLAMRVGMEDGKPGPPSLQDVKFHFAGNPNQSRLAQAIAPTGSMGDFLEDDERVTFLEWIQAGMPEGEYDEVIDPLIQNRCMGCHGDADGINQPLLNTREDIAKLAAPGEPMSVSRLALLTHIHALGMGLFYTLLGLALWFTRGWGPLKLIGMTFPLIGVLLDLGGWWLTAQVSPAFAGLVMAGGLLQGIGLIPCLLVPLWEMWWAGDQA